MRRYAAGTAVAVVLALMMVGGNVSCQEQPSPPSGSAASRDADHRAKTLYARRLGDRGTRAEVARELGRNKAAGAVEPLRAAAKDPDPNIRSACMWALGEIGDTSVASAVSFYAADPDLSVRLAAVDALSKMRCPESLDALCEAMRDGEPQVRLLAVNALATWSEDKAIRGIIRAMADPDPAVRNAATEHAVQIGEAAVRPLVESTRSATPEVRLRAVRVIAGRKDPRNVPTLVSILAASNPHNRGRFDSDLRAVVIDAIAAVGDAAIEPLSCSTVQLSGQLPLKEVAGEIFARSRSPAAVDRIATRILKWRKVPSEEELRLWLGVLRKIDTPEANDALPRVREHVEARRKEAAVAMAKPEPGAYPTAEGLETVRGDRDVTLRLKGAVRGRDLLIDFECREGRWPRTAWGYAPNLNKGDHEVKVTQVTKTAAGVRLDLSVAVAADWWVRGGPGRYRVELKGNGTDWRGNYRGEFRGRNVQGEVVVTIAGPWPIVLPHEPLKPQEHPRMRERHYKWEPPKEALVTEEGNRAMRRVLNPRQAPLGVEAGRPIAEVALLYDQYYYQADPELRKQAADFLLRKARALMYGSGGMSTPWHNWQGRWRAGAGMAALAILGDPTTYPEKPVEEQVVRFEAPADYQPGNGVPVTELNGDPGVGSNAVAKKWLAVGPFPLAADDDYLAELGGPGKARPEVGTQVVYKGVSSEFRPFEAQTVRGQAQNVDIEPLLKKRRRQVIYLFAAVENFFPHAVRVAIDANTRLWINGQPVRNDRVLRMGVGTFPVLAEARIGEVPPFLKPQWALPQLNEVPAPRETFFQQTLREWEEGHRKWQATGGASPEAERIVKLVERNLRRYIQTALGGGGFNAEKEGYTGSTLGEMAPFMRAYYYCTGKNLVMDSHAVWVPLRHKAGSFGGRGGGARFYSGEHFADLLPPDVKKALEARTPAEFPGYCVRDKQKAGYVFRNGWHGDDKDIFMTIEGKGEHLRGAHTSFDTGTFRIFGLGSAWAVYSDYGRDAPRFHHNVVLFPEDEINGLLGAKEIYFKVEKDGSGIVSLDMDDVYLGSSGTAGMADFEGRVNPGGVRDVGIRGVRGFAADYSGACGAPGLFVVVDKITGGGRKEWIMHLPGSSGARVTPEINGPTFTLRSAGVNATLKGTFVVPADVKLEVSGALLKATGSGNFFVVMTLQEGPPPEVKVEGKGLDAKVTVRPASPQAGEGQTLSFDGEKIAITR